MTAIACLCLRRFIDKMHAFAILSHCLCFAIVLIREMHCLYEDQAGMFDW